MVEQKRDDTSEAMEAISQIADEADANFMRSIGKLLVSVDTELLRQVVYESVYYMMVYGYFQSRYDLLEGIKGSDEIQISIDECKITAGMLQDPNKDWTTLKLATWGAGKMCYEELVKDRDDFDLREGFALLGGINIGAVPILQSTEFFDVARQKELFNSLLLSKLHLVPDEESIWEHPRAGEFTFDFQMP